MMPGLRARRRADEFNALVEGSSAQGAESRAAERFADDLELVAQMRAVEPVEPRPEFVADLRADLMAEAATILTPTAAKLTVRPHRTTRERRIAVAVGGFAVVSATASMAGAAQSALPGETLYPLKRAIERANSQLQFDEVRRATVLLEQAGARLAEAQMLAAEGDNAELAGTLHDFADQARGAAELILDQYQQSGDEQQVKRLSSFATTSHETLDDLQAVVPASARPALIEATRVVEQIDQQVLYSCAGCGPDVAPMAVTHDLLAGPTEPVAGPEKKAKQQPRKKSATAEPDSAAPTETQVGDQNDTGPLEPLEPLETEASTETPDKTTKKATGSLRDLTESVTGSGDGGLLEGLSDTQKSLEETTKGLLGGGQ